MLENLHQNVCFSFFIAIETANKSPVLFKIVLQGGHRPHFGKVFRQFEISVKPLLHLSRPLPIHFH